MLVLRPVCQQDIDCILELARVSGVGITSLPADQDYLERRIGTSVEAFAAESHFPGAYYLFVLEDTANQRVVGTAGIDAFVGSNAPFYCYRVGRTTSMCYTLNIHVDYQVLYLGNDYHNKTEIGALFLHPDYRCNGSGMLLSRARFLFIAHNPQRFSEVVFAEMRGISDDQGNSPFWENLGKHFFQLDYAEADRQTLLSDKQFIADLMPTYPVYVNLLPEAAQQVIGQAHPDTQPALNILYKEGFDNRSYVDIFDAGPTIAVARDEINTVRHSRVQKITQIVPQLDVTTKMMISNCSINFRVCYGCIHIDGSTCVLEQKTADALQIKQGDWVRFVA